MLFQAKTLGETVSNNFGLIRMSLEKTFKIRRNMAYNHSQE